MAEKNEDRIWFGREISACLVPSLKKKSWLIVLKFCLQIKLGFLCWQKKFESNGSRDSWENEDKIRFECEIFLYLVQNSEDFLHFYKDNFVHLCLKPTNASIELCFILLERSIIFLQNNIKTGFQCLISRFFGKHEVKRSQSVTVDNAI